METGDILESWIPGRIVGFTENVKFTSLRNGENNIAFVVGKIPYPDACLLYPSESRNRCTCGC